MCLFLLPCTAERRLVTDGHVFSLTVCGLTRIYLRPVPVPVLFLLVLGFGRCASSACVCGLDNCCPPWRGARVAVVCGYNRKHVARSMHVACSAIQRAYGDSIHDSTKTAAYVHQTVVLLPLPRCCHLQQVHRPETRTWKTCSKSLRLGAFLEVKSKGCRKTKQRLGGPERSGFCPLLKANMVVQSPDPT